MEATENHVWQNPSLTPAHSYSNSAPREAGKDFFPTVLMICQVCCLQNPLWATPPQPGIVPSASVLQLMICFKPCNTTYEHCFQKTWWAKEKTEHKDFSKSEQPLVHCTCTEAPGKTKKVHPQYPGPLSSPSVQLAQGSCEPDTTALPCSEHPFSSVFQEALFPPP